jgi:glyoxylase-like metal-dependent hydrolase (beta-lactamase superfamily II)
MRVHHLDCATMCPLARRWVNGEGSIFERGRMCGHVLLIETDRAGLVLVDSGFGEDDVREPQKRLGWAFTTVLGMKLGISRTAKHHVEALGFSVDDVRHVIPTHLDLDHAGGLPDFPKAKVHVHVREKTAAMTPPTLAERQRYRACHFEHGPDWSLYDSTGEAWKGFPAVRDLAGLPPEILAVPMTGHTRGHWLVAVQSEPSKWLLHCGDAYFHRAIVRPSEGTVPVALRVFESNAGVDGKRVHENHERLRELCGRNDPELTMFSAHDPIELERLAPAAAANEAA